MMIERNTKQRFLNACNNKPVDRPPVWLMRQAGRMLPEYQEVRRQHGFEEICHTPELAAMVTLQPVQRFDLDAAIIFSDILVVPEAMGIKVQVFPEMSLTPAIAGHAEVAALIKPRVEKALGFVAETMQIVKRAVGEDFPVLGFAGAPFTLACYMIEGGSSKSFNRAKIMMQQNPQLFSQIMALLTEVICDYLLLQIEAHADAVQLFDTWAGELNAFEFERLVLPFVRTIVDRVSKTGTPIIYFINGIGHLLQQAAATGATVLGIDWRTECASVRNILGQNQPIQGNLDPTVLFAPDATIREQVFRMLDQTDGRGHIVNLGHGVLPETPLAGVRAMIDAVADWSAGRQAPTVTDRERS